MGLQFTDQQCARLAVHAIVAFGIVQPDRLHQPPRALVDWNTGCQQSSLCGVQRFGQAVLGINHLWPTVGPRFGNAKPPPEPARDGLWQSQHLDHARDARHGFALGNLCSGLACLAALPRLFITGHLGHPNDAAVRLFLGQPRRKQRPGQCHAEVITAALRRVKPSAHRKECQHPASVNDLLGGPVWQGAVAVRFPFHRLAVRMHRRRNHREALAPDFKDAHRVFLGQARHPLQLGDFKLLDACDFGASHEVVRARRGRPPEPRQREQQQVRQPPSLGPVEVEVHQRAAVGTEAQAEVQVGIGQEVGCVVSRHGVRVVLPRGLLHPR